MTTIRRIRRTGARIPYPLGGRKYYNGDQYYGNVFRLNDTHIFSPPVINILTHWRAPPDSPGA